ncbi:MAG TPA: hypothetical protein VMA83_06750 [Solirubrobacteraceae bacterium]|nr:hypothetical protein [Solirubrobacteraceae bacterium]
MARWAAVLSAFSALALLPLTEATAETRTHGKAPCFEAFVQPVIVGQPAPKESSEERHARRLSSGERVTVKRGTIVVVSLIEGLPPDERNPQSFPWKTPRLTRPRILRHRETCPGTTSVPVENFAWRAVRVGKTRIEAPLTAPWQLWAREHHAPHSAFRPFTASVTVRR